MSEESWDRYLDTKSIRYELLAIDEDTDEVIARATSHINVDDVIAESEHITETVDRFLNLEYNDIQNDGPDYDAIAKEQNL